MVSEYRHPLSKTRPEITRLGLVCHMGVDISSPIKEDNFQKITVLLLSGTLHRVRSPG